MQRSGADVRTVLISIKLCFVRCNVAQVEVNKYGPIMAENQVYVNPFYLPV